MSLSWLDNIALHSPFALGEKSLVRAWAAICFFHPDSWQRVEQATVKSCGGFLHHFIQEKTGWLENGCGNVGRGRGGGVKYGAADVHTCKMRISLWIKIRTLPVDQKVFAAGDLKTLSTLHCYYCHYFIVPWVYIAVDCYLTQMM